MELAFGLRWGFKCRSAEDGRHSAGRIIPGLAREWNLTGATPSRWRFSAASSTYDSVAPYMIPSCKLALFRVLRRISAALLLVAAAQITALAGPLRAAAEADTAPDTVRVEMAGASDLRSRAELDEMIVRTAGRHRLDLDLVRALIRAESAFEIDAVSPAGAVGLMQIMPSTGADYGVSSTEALFDPATNLDVGMRHLRYLLDAYPGLGQPIMAYNAGEGALRESRGYVRYPETQRYTHAVLTAYLRSKGVRPYSARATEIVGFALTPAMARAGLGATGSRSGPQAPPRRAVTRLSSRLAPELSLPAEPARSGGGAVGLASPLGDARRPARPSRQRY